MRLKREPLTRPTRWVALRPPRPAIATHLSDDSRDSWPRQTLYVYPKTTQTTLTPLVDYLCGSMASRVVLLLSHGSGAAVLGCDVGYPRGWCHLHRFSKSTSETTASRHGNTRRHCTRPNCQTTCTPMKSWQRNSFHKRLGPKDISVVQRPWVNLIRVFCSR
jgi:hypothetical protein